ncbi:MAG TPA: ATP-binding cassette domain-containing protein [Bryobacteraceae bacterium]|nr:ATP-binding cassette domain-containing protein [Bryobacteraceae bacterium]
MPYSAEFSDHNCAALSGPNGCGKSTFLKAMAGSDNIRTAGSIRVRSGVSDACYRLGRRNFVYVPQDAIVISDLSVGEFIASAVLSSSRTGLFGALRSTFQSGKNWWRRELAAREEQYLEPLRPIEQPLCNLNEARLRYAALVRLDAIQPAVALLDEPFEGMGSDLCGLSLKWLGVSLSRGWFLVISDHQRRFIGMPGLRHIEAKVEWLEQ